MEITKLTKFFKLVVTFSFTEWRNVIKLGAIDCAHNDHTAICREFDIMGYPTVKFFPARDAPSNLGTELPRIANTEKSIVRNVVGILQKEQLEGRGGHNWPNLIPYRSYDTSNLWKGNDDVQYIFLIFADGNDSLAAEIILDFSQVKEIQIRSVVPENEVLSRLLGVTSYPSLVLIERTKKEPEILHSKENTRESFRLVIKSFLKKKNISFPEEQKLPDILNSNDIPSVGELQVARNNLVQILKIKELGDVVFLIDLENTLKYSLEHEISSHKDISGEAYVALNKFLIIIHKYFPTGEAGAVYLQKLIETVSSQSEMTGSEFKENLNNLSRGGLESVLLTKKDWMGCRGSEDHLRRYPCGMWTLFHYMTVNALRDSSQSNFNPLEVLDAMLSYVTHFFGCTECSKHFQEMSQNKSMRTKVKTGDEAVLWLWSAHNEVNKRLSKDKSEDPQFPKITFPSPERCPNCRDKMGDWNEKEILNYLISVYSRENLIQMGSEGKLSFYNKSRVEYRNMKKIGKDFNIFDISLCVALYMASAIICVGVCMKFVLKKKYRKKSYVQDLLGKV